MSKRIGGVVALAGLCALSFILLNCGSSSSRPAGTLYVVTQGINGNGNDVSSFSMNLNNGDLSLVNSSTPTCAKAPTGGDLEPCGTPLEIVLDPTGATAFVLNQGVPCVQQGTQCVSGSENPVAPSLYSYTVASNGSLTPSGSPVSWTANSYPDTAVAMTRDAAGLFLFVIDQGSYPPPGFPNPTQSNPSCPHAPANENDVCPSISVFAMKPGSTALTLASGSPHYLSKIPTGLSTVTFTPSTPNVPAQELLFVSNNEDICTQNCVLPQHSDNTVAVYNVNSSGFLTEQSNSPYIINAPDPISVIAVNTNPPGGFTGGVFVYVGNQGASGALNPFQICTVQNAVCTSADVQNSLLTPLGTCPQQSCNFPPTPAGQNPVAMVVDPTNNFLYVVSQGSNQVFGLRVNTVSGKLTSLIPPNQPTGTAPVALALHPAVNNTGQFLFISNSASDNITGFTLSTTTGGMSNPSTVIAPAAPLGLTAH